MIELSGRMELQRFIDAQQSDFRKALSEIKHGRKQSHWMWYIFPQIRFFQLILDKFFKEKKGDKTVRLLKKNNHTAE
ncbi:MAG: DUF1810 family protein [Puia sp.]